MQPLLMATALTPLLLCLQVSSVAADDGGGADSITGQGGAGSAGNLFFGGGGGGAGQTGGSGGYTTNFDGDPLGNGGAGGSAPGGDGGNGSSGGGGGGGAHGFVDTDFTALAGAAKGGDGGDGIGGGGGGAGGYGVVITDTGNLGNSGQTATGGGGGNGSSMSLSFGSGGRGGNGMVFSNATGPTVNINAMVTGGNGGNGGPSGFGRDSGGAGGNGVVSENGGGITTSAAVTGGNGGVNANGGNGIVFGGSGTLTTGSTTTGGNGATGGAGIVVTGTADLNAGGTVTGGNGAAGVSFASTGIFTIIGTVTGGNGPAGVSFPPGTFPVGGTATGGSGGVGADVTGSTTTNVNGALTGGGGGAGGVSGSFGIDGGAGASGLVLASVGTVNVNAATTGGNGGAGGDGVAGGDGGSGGTAIVLTNGGTVNVNAAVTGGQGGAAGGGVEPGFNGSPGGGGAGISGDGIDITMTTPGSVSGGSGANAITFTGGTNSINGTGGTITGVVRVDTGATLDIDGATLDLTSAISNIQVSGTLNLSGSVATGDVAQITTTGSEIHYDNGAAVASAILLNSNDTTLDVDTGDAAEQSGNITETGGVRTIQKTGGGTLALTGDSSGFTGATTVSGGVLLVGDTAGSGILGGDVLVGSGGTLGGSGKLTGSVTIDGGTLAPGNSPGTLTVDGDLTLKTGSTTVFELNTPGVVGAGDNDLVVVGGNLALDGTLKAHVAAAGYYQLFDYDGALSGSFTDEIFISVAGFTVGSHQMEYTAPGTVGLTVLGAGSGPGGGPGPSGDPGPGPGSGQAIRFWDGADVVGNGVVDGGAGSWTAGNTNWTGQPGQAELNSAWGGSIGVFRGAAGTVTVAGPQSFDTLQFSTDGYVVKGDALAIGGAGGSTFNIDADVTATIGSAIIDGAGTALRKAGSGTLVLTGSSSLSEGTTVAGGTLLVGNGAGGTLGGAIAVLSGARLGGVGTIGTAGSAVTIAPGSNHTPGDGTSTGQQTVAGDYVNHGTLTIAGAPSGTSRVVVAGAVDITGATLALLLSPSRAADWSIANGPFTIIDKQGDRAVTGSFGAVEDLNDLLFLNHTLDYAGGDGNDVALTLKRNDIDFGGVADTANQQAVAEAIENLGNGNAIWDAIALSSADHADLVRASFDALSGEIHASGQTALVNTGLTLGNAVDSRLRSAFDTAGAGIAPVLAYGPGGPELAAPDTALSVAWGAAYGAWGSIDGDGNAAGLDTTGGGFAAGIDGQLGDWRLGLLAGYGQSGFEAGDRASTGDSDNYSLGLYGGTQWGNLAFRSGLAASWHDIDTDRTIAVPGLSDQLAASYGARSTLAFGELGYRFDLTKATMVEPFANLTHLHLSTDGFTETGGVAALTSAGSVTDTSFTTLGLRASTQFALGTVLGTVHAMAGWRHGFGDLAPTSTLAFATGSDSFTISGAPLARDTALIQAGLDLSLSDTTSIGLTYDGQFAKGVSNNAVSADLSVKF